MLAQLKTYMTTINLLPDYISAYRTTKEGKHVWYWWTGIGVVQGLFKK